MKPTGALKFTCKDESEKLQLQMKFDRARRVLNPEPNTVSNENLLNIVFDYFLAHCYQTTTTTDTYRATATSDDHPGPYTNNFCGKELADEEVFVA